MTTAVPTTALEETIKWLESAILAEDSLYGYEERVDLVGAWGRFADEIRANPEAAIHAIREHVNAMQGDLADDYSEED